MNQLSRALRFFKPDGHRLALVVFFLLGAVGANLLRPWPVALIVDSVFGDRPFPAWLQSIANVSDHRLMLGLLALGVLLLHLAQGGLSTAVHYVGLQIGLNGMRRAREEMFGCLQRLSARFVQAGRSGDLVHRTATDTYSLYVLFQEGILTTAFSLLSLIGMLVILWRLNALLTLFVLIVLPLLLLITRFFTPRVSERGVMAQQADSQVTSFIQQSIAALPLTQSAGREEHEASAFKARTLAAFEKRRMLAGWDLGLWFVVAVVFGVAAAGLVWLGGKQVLAGRLSLGQLLVFLAYLPLIYEPLRHLSRVGGVVEETATGIGRVFELLDTPEQVRDTLKARPVVDARTAGDGPSGAESRAIRLAGNIEFDNVSFGDQRDPAVLQGLSFRIEAGQAVALIGPNAVAKSTVLNLLGRFFDPVSGVVRIEGVDVREMRLKDLRSLLAVVSAEPILLPASIGENIAYGKPRARRTEIEAAARAAQAEEFIKRLPNGYLTMIGEGGTRLSPGERHRLGLARAFMRDSPIVLMDEPAGGIESESEDALAASVRELLKGRTAVIVAHRLTTLRAVQRILVLRDGRIIEDGLPTDLRKGEGYYAKLAKGELALD